MEYDRKNNLFLTGTDKFELRVVFFDLTWCLKYVNYFARSMGAHVDKAAWLNFFSDPGNYRLYNNILNCVTQFFRIGKCNSV